MPTFTTRQGKAGVPSPLLRRPSVSEQTAVNTGFLNHFKGEPPRLPVLPSMSRHSPRLRGDGGCPLPLCGHSRASGHSPHTPRHALCDSTGHAVPAPGYASAYHVATLLVPPGGRSFFPALTEPAKKKHPPRGQKGRINRSPSVSAGDCVLKHFDNE